MNDVIASATQLLINGSRIFDCAASGAALIALHEGESLRGHWTELSERLALARSARSPGQLIGDQFDLLTETRSRLRHNREVRRQLWRGLLKDLAEAGRPVPAT